MPESLPAAAIDRYRKGIRNTCLCIPRRKDKRAV